MAVCCTERDRLIALYAVGPTRLKTALATVPPEALKWRPAHARIRFLLTEQDPVIQGYDQTRWARTLDYHSHPLEPELATVEAVRANTTALIRRLPDEAWTREGRHTESGRYTAEDWLMIYADHLEGHAWQIEQNVTLWRAR